MSLLQEYVSSTSTSNRTTSATAYLAILDHLKSCCPNVCETIVNELRAQRSHLKLIASENYSSLSVQLAMGNLLTDKYSEGFPFHRFYAGCENVDAIESEAAGLAKQIFQADHAYVQPHSGADANLVAYWAILTGKIQSRELEKMEKKNLNELSPEAFERMRQALCNQTLMGLSLSSGGHLTHGYRHNVSAKMFRAVTYDVSKRTGLLDYDEIASAARREKPLILLAGYSAYPRLINFAKMRDIADEVGAVLMVDMAHFAGLVAGKAFSGENDPVPFAHILTTTTHKTLRGPRGGLVLCKKEFADEVNKGCPLVLGGPLPHVIAAKAVAFKEASTLDFRGYARKIIENAKSLAEGLIKRGLQLVTGGTDNHLLLIDLTSLGLTGKQGESALHQAGMTLNRNMIPFDPQGAWHTSGLRLGTPSLTTLGMGTDAMDEIADIIAAMLKSTRPGKVQKSGQSSKTNIEIDETIVDNSRQRVASLLKQFPLYPEIPIL